MKSFRENPEGEANQKASKQAERERFALKMMKKQQAQSEYCPTCGMLKSQCVCWDAINHHN